METGSLFTTFFIVFRETLEASLIVGVILTVLARMQQKKYFPSVITSCGAAIFVSVLAGFLLMSFTGNRQGLMKELMEGSISLLACGVLTYMIFWMDRQARTIKTEIENKMETAISRKDLLIIVSLPFLAIFREGAETVLFLNAVASQNSGVISWAGGLTGFLFATLIAVIIFIGGKKIPLRPLFKTTGWVLLLIAAGLLAYGIHELEEAGVIPVVYGPIWNINHILNEKEGLGALLKSLFGYNGNPSLVEFLSYAGYLVTIYLILKKSDLGFITAKA